MSDFKNKTVLITGASRGIGKATAIAFANEGAKVAVNFKSNIASAQHTLNELEGNGHALFQHDISRKKGQKQLIDDVVKHFGKIDILVNNAGISI